MYMCMYVCFVHTYLYLHNLFCAVVVAKQLSVFVEFSMLIFNGELFVLKISPELCLVTTLKAGENCTAGNGMCGNKLRCGRCTKNPDTEGVCLSGTHYVGLLLTFH